jgi:hypothetical protein
MESQHDNLQGNTTIYRATNFTPFQMLYRSEAVLLEEIKDQSLQIATEVPPRPSEAKEKDLLEPNGPDQT